MAVNINGKEITFKQVLETVFDLLIVLVAVAVAGGIFIQDEASLKESLVGLAFTAAVGLAVWKVVSSYKLIDK